MNLSEIQEIQVKKSLFPPQNRLNSIMPDYNYNSNTLEDLALIFFKSDNKKIDTLDCEKLVNDANFFTLAAGDYLTGEKNRK
jgi:hypothetical protein